MDKTDKNEDNITKNQLADTILKTIYNKPNHGLGHKLRVKTIIHEVIEKYKEEQKDISQKDLEEAFRYLAKAGYIRGSGRITEIAMLSFKGQVYVQSIC